MIKLICTHCRATLEMDDGFAGGACRCQHCGTIQTVPSHLKNKTSGAKKVRTLYQNSPQSALPSSGLDQLADVVASSGLTSARLKKPAAPPAQKQEQKQPNNVKALLIGAAAIIVVLCGALIYMMTRDRSPNPAPAVNASATVAPGATPIAPHAAPNFCGVALGGDTIVYVLDRGDSTRENFDALKSLTLKSIGTLGASRKFQILFWNNGRDDGYPRNWATFATADNIADAERALDPISAHGKTDIKSALKAAFSANPSEIIIATGKAWDLDDTFVKTVDQIRGANNVRIDTFALSDPGQSTALQTIAVKARGTFKTLTDADLKDPAR